MDAPDDDLNLQLLRAYIDSANDGIFVVCDEMKFHVANRRLEDWLATPETVLTEHCGRIPLTDFLPDADDRDHFRHCFEQTLGGRPARLECRLAPPSGAERWVEINMSRVALEVGSMVIGLVRDIGRQRELSSELERRARTDDLTGLPNRGEFWRCLQRLIDEGGVARVPYGLLYVDLDQLKIVNETCGHIAGDTLLREAATVLRRSCPDTAMLGRLGGDEFAVLLEDSDADATVRTARSILQALGRSAFRWDGASFALGCSIGVVHLSQRWTSVPDILGAADAACYVAKDRGRNRIQVYADRGPCRQRRTEAHWVERISRALREERFALFHQRIVPISVHASGAESRAHEILLRMRAHNGAIVRPQSFLPAAERYNLMPAVDRWVVERVLRALAPGTTATPVPDLCFVNLSGASINDRSFPGFLKRRIERHGVDPARLCFEITETVAVRNIKRATRVVRQLRELGCRFALDDFGSGMSSFAYLKALPVDFLKIDGSLIRGAARPTVDRAIVASVRDIAASMGIATIAEFVESAAIRQALADIGIDYGQGYAIHEPSPLVCAAAAAAAHAYRDAPVTDARAGGMGRSRTRDDNRSYRRPSPAAARTRES